MKGPCCEYNTAVVCSVDDLKFNGQHECTVTDDSKECVFSCAKGMKPSQPFAALYKCGFSKGKFQPESVPSCVPEAEPTAEGSLDASPTKGKCYTWSGMHYKTFDGKIYGFTSPCPYVLAEDVVDDTFKITIENSMGCDFAVTDNCSKIIKIYYEEMEYDLKLIDGTPAVIYGDKRLDMPVELRGITIMHRGPFISVNIDQPLVKIKWDGYNYVKVTVGQELWKKTGGLCGKSDGRVNNDMSTKEGKATDDVLSFIQSWQIDSKEVDKCGSQASQENRCLALKEDKQDEAKKFCQELLGDSRFEACNGRVDVNQFLYSCIWSYCACDKADPKECTCETVNIYARDCMENGVTGLEGWRTQFCPIKCPHGKTYSACAPKGAVCGEEEQSAKCEEGCYCPEGMVLHNDKCISRTDCPCKFRGKEVLSGISVSKGCNVCTCKEGNFECTKRECKARCSSVGDPHYMTFDGKRYDFMGHCMYYLVKHANFSIIAENIPCTGTVEEMANLRSNSELPSCTKSAIIEYGGHKIHLNQNFEVIVDGIYIRELPFAIDGVTVRHASSTFILAELPINVQVTWDGSSRLFVDGSSALYGETKGLCGTFNNNKDDDFLMPDGTIEVNEVRFGNSWKTDPTCGDASENVEHPCVRNPKNKAAAQKNCKMIKSKLFADCHWEVDPETFYQECLFDVCSCELKLPRCFCPMIASYAAECARKGVDVEWRTKVKGCGVQCKSGQVYQACGNPCARSCSQIAKQEECQPECVEGCNCPVGQALNQQGTCVPIASCECEMDGAIFPAGHVETKNLEDTLLSCTCENALWSCKPIPRTEIFTLSLKETCSLDDKKYTLCAATEPVTCKNMHKEIAPPPKETCKEGCECPPGRVLGEDNETCVQPTDCPCFYGGQSHKEGHVVKDECNSCTCKDNKWICTDNKCPGLCSVWGNSHFKTFDGKEFDYQGQCDYVLTMGEVEKVGSFQVNIQNEPCGSSVSCLKSVTISINDGNGEETVVLSSGSPIPDASSNKQIHLHDLSHYVIANLPKFGVMITWDKGNRVYVSLEPELHDKVKGLCGNFNDYRPDDFKNPEGVLEDSTEKFGDSWSLQPQCPTAEKITDTCENKSSRKKWANKICELLNSAPFSLCHDKVSVGPYVKKCIFDACGCDEGGDSHCVCTAFAAYAYECNRNGISIHWRTPTLCPMQCDSTCSHYDPCISICPSKDDVSPYVYKKQSHLCGKKDVCLEGCKARSCSALATVKLPCMVIEGKVFYEGDLIEESECRACHCWGGKKECQCIAGI
uniref:VWFD domain-containing protein n=3 Tax=Photinus pyralis TaxID=7054 RepID=A0A1Y1MR36_PHOPY